jgi:hypothetical protein
MKMCGKIILLIVAIGSIFTVYGLLKHLHSKSDVEKDDSGSFSSRIYVCSLVGMFSCWFLYWFYLVAADPMQGRVNGRLLDFNMFPVGIMGIVAGAAVGLLSRKWKM